MINQACQKSVLQLFFCFGTAAIMKLQSQCTTPRTAIMQQWKSQANTSNRSKWVNRQDQRHTRQQNLSHSRGLHSTLIERPQSLNSTDAVATSISRGMLLVRHCYNSDFVIIHEVSWPALTWGYFLSAYNRQCLSLMQYTSEGSNCMNKRLQIVQANSSRLELESETGYQLLLRTITRFCYLGRIYRTEWQFIVWQDMLTFVLLPWRTHTS